MTDVEINLSSIGNDNYNSSNNQIPVTAATVPVAPPKMMFSVPQQPEAMTPEQLSQLQQQGYPSGLAKELRNTKISFPVRFWVVDNSGSMRSTDGHQLRGDKNNIKVVNCNRWTELQASVEYHADLAGLLDATTIFRMLNDPGAVVGPQEFTVADTSTGIAADQQVQTAKTIIGKAEPSGVTPLSEHVYNIRARIEAIAPRLRANGQQAVIVLATDGLPSNAYGESTPQIKDEFTSALRSLQNLPVWVVIRLCTDNDETVEFYNDLDNILELPFEVIDDFFGEGKEIAAANKWLNYGLPLHRCREMGYHHRVFDLLDERLLTKDELREFLGLMFGKEQIRGLPDPQLDWKTFSRGLKKIVQSNGVVYDPNRRKTNYWVDMKTLDKCYGSGGLRLFRRQQT